jgi:hypothetical protein
MGFKYPEHPNTNRKDPFRDKDGRNPYAEEQPAGQPSDNPYEASATDEGATYRVECETTLPHRGGLVYWLGTVGLASSALGAATTLACAAVPGAAGTSTIGLSAFLLPLGAIAAWSAWMMGRHDVRAMDAGAMEAGGRARTRKGRLRGMLGTLLAIAPIVYVLVQLLKTLAEEL